MTDISRSLSSHDQHSRGPAEAAGFDETRWVVLGDDRIGPAPVDRRRRRLLRRAALISLAAGGVWLGAHGYLDWVPPLAVEGLRTAERMLTPARVPVSESENHAAGDALPMLEFIIARDIAPAPAVAGVPIAPVADAAASESDALPEAPARRDGVPHPVDGERDPAADTTDPLVRRALAAGLHPDISRVLLARLAPEDFANAGIAIRKALAETPDGEALDWPRPERRGLATFRVHFVPGAQARCRRYVVTIGRDGWLTTALPMEMCGLATPVSARR